MRENGDIIVIEVKTSTWLMGRVGGSMRVRRGDIILQFIMKWINRHGEIIERPIREPSEIRHEEILRMTYEIGDLLGYRVERVYSPRI